MRFEELSAGESRQINGPLFGVRVLSSGAGSAVLVDRVALPLLSLLSLPAPRGRPFDRLNLTGPIVVQIAEAEEDELNATSAAHAEVWAESAVVIPAGELSGNPQEWVFTRPAWATRAHVLYTVGSSSGTGATAWRIYERTAGGVELPSNVDETAGTGAALDFTDRMNTLAAWGYGSAALPIGAGWGPPPASMRIRLLASASRVLTSGILVVRWAAG